MTNRSTTGRLRRTGLLGLLVGIAVLALAQMASAQTVTFYQPQTTADLQSDVTAADANNAAGTLNVIQLCGCQYTLTAPLTLSSNIELTGPPTYQTNNSPSLQDPNINGQNLFGLAPSVNMITVATGGNVVIKAVDLQAGGTTATYAVSVNNGGQLELDNAAIDGSTGTSLNVNAGGSATVTDSDISDGASFGVQSANGATTTLTNDTIANNSNGGIAGVNVNVTNSILSQFGADGVANCSHTPGNSYHFINTYADDASCPGATEDDNLINELNFTGFNGGPTESTALESGPEVNGANALYCGTSDQRFFIRGSGCDAGSYQINATQGTQTETPVCTVQSVNRTSNPQTMTVLADDSTIGMGPDAILGTTTDNGTVSYPTVGSTWFAVSSPGTPSPGPMTLPSKNGVPVTATKPAGDTAVNDTHWSFTAENWLANQTLCK